MAYDPKSYLEQALQQGFESVYTPGGSLETGEAPQYQGELAKFGDIEVRQLVAPIYEGTGDSQNQIGTQLTGEYMVSAPLTGKYEGYSRNDIYDSQGNFVRTTISEPYDSGWKDLASIGLMALSGGILGPTGQLFSKGVGAIGALQSGDPLRILGAISGLPGAGDYIPAELQSVAKYAGQAGQIKSALSGDPSAIFGLVTGAAKSGALPDGKAASAGYGGAETEGFFDAEREGTPGKYYAGLENVFSDWDDADIIPDTYDTAPKTTMSPNDMAKFLEANIDDPGSIEMLMQEYYPELYRQQIGVTGKREVSEPIYEQPPTPAPEPIYEQPPTPAPGPAPAGKPGAPKSPGTPSKPSTPGFDPSSLLAFFNTQKPAEEPYRVAQTVASPFGTIYDTYGGNDMQDLLGFLRRG